MDNCDKNIFLKELMSRNYKPLDKILPETAVGIAGCGGLGSNIAHMLVRSGIGKLILADFDTVVMSNLNRQFFFVEDLGKSKVDALEENLKKINPYIQIEKFNIKVTADNLFKIFQNTPIIAEAFDQVSQKTMILNSFLERDDKTGYLVSASGMGGIDSSNLIKTKEFGNSVFLCGDFSNDFSHGLMASRVNIAAAHQANMILRIIAEKLDP
jgi:sulfur carrier protein ThiS adenylyltransferase